MDDNYDSFSMELNFLMGCNIFEKQADLHIRRCPLPPPKNGLLAHSPVPSPPLFLSPLLIAILILQKREKETPKNLSLSIFNYSIFKMNFGGNLIKKLIRLNFVWNYRWSFNESHYILHVIIIYENRPYTAFNYLVSFITMKSLTRDVRSEIPDVMMMFWILMPENRRALSLPPLLSTPSWARTWMPKKKQRKKKKFSAEKKRCKINGNSRFIVNDDDVYVTKEDNK